MFFVGTLLLPFCVLNLINVFQDDGVFQQGVEGCVKGAFKDCSFESLTSKVCVNLLKNTEALAVTDVFSVLLHVCNENVRLSLLC